MQDGVHGRCGDLRLCHFHLYTLSLCDKSLKLSLYDPFSTLQDGVHGRCDDLSLCHYHLFTKSFETVPLRSHFLPCRMVCMAGAVTSFAILTLSLCDKIFWNCPFKIPLFCHAGWCAWQGQWPPPFLFTTLYKIFWNCSFKTPFLSCRMVCMAGAVTSAFAIFISLQNLLNCPFKIPFFAMQDGVHGRCGDLRPCHFYLFKNSLKLSL